jgi:hypothetical protein
MWNRRAHLARIGGWVFEDCSASATGCRPGAGAVAGALNLAVVNPHFDRVGVTVGGRGW